VIKEIDHTGLGSTGTPREQIMREVRARIEVDAKAHKKAEPRRPAAAADNGARGKGKKQAAREAARAEAAAASQPSGQDSANPTEGAAVPSTSDAASNADVDAANEAAAATAAPTGAASLDDEAMDADSTTTVDSTRNHRAKEATP
jgi:hypothetical protein